MTASAELEALRLAVERFAAAAHADACPDQGMVTQALLVFETVCFDPDGEAARAISYAVPTDNFSLSGALGLIDVARFYVRKDILGEPEDDL